MGLQSIIARISKVLAFQILLAVGLGLLIIILFDGISRHIVRKQIAATGEFRQPWDVALEDTTDNAWLCTPLVMVHGQIRGPGWLTVDVTGKGDKSPSLSIEGMFKPDPMCNLKTLGTGKYHVWRSDPPGISAEYTKVGTIPRPKWQKT